MTVKTIAAATVAAIAVAAATAATVTETAAGTTAAMKQQLAAHQNQRNELPSAFTRS